MANQDTVLYLPEWGDKLFAMTHEPMNVYEHLESYKLHIINCNEVNFMLVSFTVSFTIITPEVAEVKNIRTTCQGWLLYSSFLRIEILLLGGRKRYVTKAHKSEQLTTWKISKCPILPVSNCWKLRLWPGKLMLQRENLSHYIIACSVTSNYYYIISAQWVKLWWKLCHPAWGRLHKSSSVQWIRLWWDHSFVLPKISFAGISNFYWLSPGKICHMVTSTLF